MKFKLSKLVVGLAVAVCAFSGQAVAGSNHSVTYELSLASNGDGTYGANFGSFTDGTSSWGGGTLGPSNLADVFNFSLTSSQAGQLSSIYASTSSNLPGLSFSLMDVTKNTLVDSSTNDGQGNAYFVATPNMGADNFRLTVTDMTPGAAGVYNGSLTVSPVPEPTEGALLLSGLGLMGFIAARRRRKAA